MVTFADYSFLERYVNKELLAEAQQKVTVARQMLLDKSGAGSDYLGWLCADKLLCDENIADIQRCADTLRSDSDVILVLGIGGSYLGSRATIEWLASKNHNQLNSPEIHFAGNELSPAHYHHLMNICEGKRVTLIVISKSGTTLETAVAFRVFRDYMKRRYGCQHHKRILAITDETEGLLRALATSQHYNSFAIPNDIGGRFSVFTPVGMVPIAAAGIDIRALAKGAITAQHELLSLPFSENPAMQYAATRHALYQKGYRIELFCGWDSSMMMLLEWAKQLFGESEGKDEKGLFPASACYSTDLHSLGQFVQQGPPILFETFISFLEEKADLSIPVDQTNSDQLNYLCDKTLGEINRMAKDAVIQAHRGGDVPVCDIVITRQDAFSYGYLLYFFLLSCALSGYALGVNPFDQPGVEQYKQKMFKMLGKPGFDK